MNSSGSAPGEKRLVAGLARDFLCEHTPSKSRVFVLVSHPHGRDSLQAVLTCPDRELAQQIADLLRQAARLGSTSEIRNSAKHLGQQLLDAPAASLRQALDRVVSGAWTSDASMLHMRRDGEADFAGLFRPGTCDCSDGVLAQPEHDEDCEAGYWQFTARTADILHTSLSILADEAYDDADSLGGNSLRAEDDGHWGFFGRLPRLTWRQDKQWRRRVARACDDLVSDLERGVQPEPTCPAEEMVLHLAIEDAIGHQETTVDSPHRPHHQLPTHPDDYDWDGCSDMLFQDHDVLMLFDAALDGAEDPESDINMRLGIGDLRAAAWFNSFNNVKARDPQRGFRR